MNKDILEGFDIINEAMLRLVGLQKLALQETKALVSLLDEPQQDLWVSRVKQFCAELGIDPTTGASLKPKT